MIIKQPSLRTVVLVASASFFDDMVCAGRASSNLVSSSTAREALLTAAGPGDVTVSSLRNGLNGIEPGVIRSQAPTITHLNAISV